MARILVCEDSHSQALNVRVILESAGHEVVVAENGTVGLMHLEVSAFDLVLSDVQMPGLSGFDLCRKIRTHPQCAGLPVILMTTLNEMHDMRRGQDVGANMYVVKPFEPDDLLRRLNRFLASRVAAPGSAAAPGPAATPVPAAAPAPKTGIVALRELLTVVLSLVEKGLAQRDVQSLTDVLEGIRETANQALVLCGVASPKPTVGPTEVAQKLVLVEPSDPIKNVLTPLLKKVGFVVLPVNSAADGVAACQAQGQALSALVTEASTCSPELMKAARLANPKAPLLCLIDADLDEGDRPIMPADVATLTRPFTANALVSRLKEMQSKQ